MCCGFLCFFGVIISICYGAEDGHGSRWVCKVEVGFVLVEHQLGWDSCDVKKIKLHLVIELYKCVNQGVKNASRCDGVDKVRSLSYLSCPKACDFFLF